MNFVLSVNEISWRWLPVNSVFISECTSTVRSVRKYALQT